MEPAAKLAVLTLVTLLSLSQWFSDGITCYKKKDYAGAVASFTKVIDEKVESNPLYQPSLYWRAQCYIQMTKTNEAAADLRLLLDKAPDGEFASLAGADMKKLTGNDWDLVSQGTPEETWASICKAVAKRDKKALFRCFSGKMAADGEREFDKEGDHIWQEMAKVQKTRLTEVRYNKNKTAALISFIEGPDENSHRQQLVMEKTNGKWTISKDHISDDEKAEFGQPVPVKPAALATPAMKLTAAEQAEIENLIIQLGASEAKARKEAYVKLHALGAKAAKLLEKAQTDPDPEIAAQAKRLLSEL